MRLGFVALMAAALLLAACGDDDSEGGGAEEAATVEIEGQAANDHGSAEVSDSVELEEDDYYFEPTVLTGEAGRKVTLEITNEGDEEHNITIEDQGIDEDTEPGKSTTVKAEIPGSGAIVFYCSYHQSQNMRGALAVTGFEPSSGSEPSSGGGYGSGGY